jgi:hypothetical protein
MLRSASQPPVGIGELGTILRDLLSENEVNRIDGPDSSVPCWAITRGGVDRLVDAKSDAALADRASKLEEPPTALLCIDEDELDNWWQNLDVEQKADAFSGYTLDPSGSRSHIYIEPAIHVLGTIGADAVRRASQDLRDMESQVKAAVRQ